MPEKTGPKKDVRIEVWVTPKLAAYLDTLIEREGYGNSRPEVVRRLTWQVVNELRREKFLKD